MNVRQLIRNCTLVMLMIAPLYLIACDDQETGTAWQSEYVRLGEDDRLVYKVGDRGDVIPDFSHVGYRFGDEPIPDVPVRVEIEPVEGDNGAHIQAAIDRVSALPADRDGFRGAVLLRKGAYPVDGTLRIHTSGVVLRGEGQEVEGTGAGDDAGGGKAAGTMIVATGTDRDPLILVTGSGRAEEIPGSRVAVAEAYVPVGRTHVVVASAAGYAPGDEIVLFRPGTQAWVDAIKMDTIPPREDGRQVFPWDPAGYDLRAERVVTRVAGDTLFFRNPVVMPLEEAFGGGQVYRIRHEGRIRQVGVESLRMRSEYAHEEDEDHAWNAIQIEHAEHGWVRDITAEFFAYSAVSIESTAKHITVLNSTMLTPKSIITGSRRYSFNVEGQMNLVKGCRAVEGRHDFVTGARVSGPNVFLDGVAERAQNDAGPHHRWAMGTLYDNITTDGELNVQNRGNRGSGHGWSGINHVVWNSRARTAVVQSPWVSGTNYMIGFTGEKVQGFSPESPDGVWEGHNRSGLHPRSLYEAQLGDRRRD